MTRATQVRQAAIVVVVALIVLNVAFYILSATYFSDKKTLEEQMRAAIAMSSARIWFAVFTAFIGGASIVASAAPRLVGHAIAAIMGVLSIIASLVAFAHGMTPVLPFTLLVLGLLLPLLTYFSIATTSRSAWAFLVSICGVYGTVMLFGAPKVRYLLDIGLWSAMIIPGVMFVATASLVMSKAAYRDAV